MTKKVWGEWQLRAGPLRAKAGPSARPATPQRRFAPAPLEHWWSHCRGPSWRSHGPSWRPRGGLLEPSPGPSQAGRFGAQESPTTAQDNPQRPPKQPSKPKDALRRPSRAAPRFQPPRLQDGAKTTYGLQIIQEGAEIAQDGARTTPTTAPRGLQNGPPEKYKPTHP